MKRLDIAIWKAQARELFGENSLDWTFQCPRCGCHQSGRLFLLHGLPLGRRPYTSCIGRWVKGIGACQFSFTLPTLIAILPKTEVRNVKNMQVILQPVFQFAGRKLRLEMPEEKPKEPWRYYRDGKLIGGGSHGEA